MEGGKPKVQREAAGDSCNRIRTGVKNIQHYSEQVVLTPAMKYKTQCSGRSTRTLRTQEEHSYN